MTEGILATVVINKKVDKLTRVNGAKYVSMSLGVPGIKKIIKSINSIFFFSLKKIFHLISLD